MKTEKSFPVQSQREKVKKRSLCCRLPQYEWEIRTIRALVFVKEQNIPPELDWDDREAECLHALAWFGDKPAATGRLDLEQSGKIGRVAVLQEFRGQGLGRIILDELEAAAREAELKSIWLNAQSSVIPFYAKLGFQTIGSEFLEVGIPHQRMEKFW